MKRILFLLIILTLGFAETILIPEDFATIQEGIDASVEVIQYLLLMVL
jgi:hypothetical protein